MFPVDPPIVEDWTLPEGEFPDHITIDGEVFNKAIRQQGYDGVICQYRAAVPRNSAHLLVLNDGKFIIDHIDEYNPDMGHPVRHWIVDHPAGKGSVIAGLGVVGVIGSALYGAQKGKNNGNQP